MAQDVIVRIQGLNKTFRGRAGTVVALNGIDLDIYRGEIFGIIGLSGAGKSTLVRCINFLEKPTEGTVTVDGEELGELGYETFNAAEAVLTLAGKNIHPGSAKGKMLNCALMAGEFLAAFPESETPAATEGREGFYHIESVRAEVESGEIKLIIRDHDAEKFEARKRFVEGVCAQLKEKYGESAAEVKIRDQYRNCLEKIREHFHLVENARKAFAEAGVTPVEAPVRGGTDGCTLSFMGLPCPNLSTGGVNFHGIFEYIPVPSLEKMVEVLVQLVRVE